MECHLRFRAVGCFWIRSEQKAGSDGCKERRGHCSVNVGRVQCKVGPAAQLRQASIFDSMIPTTTLDMREWTAAAMALKETSSRTAVDFINGQSLKVAIESVRQTEKANRSEISRVLGEIGRAPDTEKIRTRDTKRGRKGSIIRVKGRRQVKEDSYAERILAKRFRETGKWGAKGETMEARVLNFIASKSRAAGFIASGWIGCRNALWTIVRQKAAGTRTIAGARQYGRAKGKARPATFSLRSIMSSEIENTALMSMMGDAPAPGGNPMPVAVKGLQAALNVAARDMINELARRLNPDFKKVSAR